MIKPQAGTYLKQAETAGGYDRARNDTFTVTELGALIGAILLGEKPVLDPSNDPRDRAFVALLDQMYAANDLDAPPTKYYTDANWSAEKRASRRLIDTRHHTLHIGAMESFRATKAELLAEEYRNFEILGARPEFRRFGPTEVHGQPLRLIESAENFILTERADLWAIYQALHLMQEPERSTNRIFVHANNDRTKQFLSLLGIESRNQAIKLSKSLEKTGVSAQLMYVYENESFLERFQQYAIDVRQKPPAAMLAQMTREGPQLPPVIYFNTGNPEKLITARSVVSASGIAATVRTADEMGGPNKASEEYFETFSGNAYDKHRKALVAKLKTLQADPALAARIFGTQGRPVWVMSADEGAVFNDQGVFGHDAFRIAHEQKLVSSDGDAPGPETKPMSGVLDGTRTAYINACKQAGYTGDLQSVDHAVIALSQLTPELVASRDWSKATEADLPPTVFIKSTADLIYRLGDGSETAKAPTGRPETEFDYKVFDGCSMTQQQMLDHPDESVQMQAHTRAAFGLGLPSALSIIGAPTCGALRQTFEAAAKSLVVAVNPHIPAPHAEAAAVIADRDNVTLYNHAPITTLADLKTVIEEADAYVHVPTDQAMTRDQYYMGLLFSCGSFVGKQLGDSLVNGNPTGYVNASANKPAADFMAMLQHKRLCGMVTERPDVFFFSVNDNGEKPASELLGLAFKRCVDTFDKGEYKPQREPSARVAMPDHDGPVATIFLSASASRPDLLTDAYDLSYNLVTNNIGTLSGGGDKNMMGACSYGGLVARMHNNPEGFVGGIQDPYAMIREGAPDAELNAVMGEGHFTVAPDRYARMFNLLELDRLRALPEGSRQKLLIVQPGGIGTDEELLAAVWLKSIDEPGLKDAKIIIQNKPLKMQDGTVVRPYDQVIKMIGPEDMAKYNIVVCETVAEIVAEAGRYYGVETQYQPQNYMVGPLPFDVTQNGAYPYVFTGYMDKLAAHKGLLSAAGSDRKVALG